MLVRFTVSNYLSFNDEASLSMIKGNMRKHPEHIIQDDSWDGIKLLKSAAIYGANASGKSNLVRALNFCKRFVVEDTKAKSPIDIPKFKFDTASKKKPSTFQTEMKIGDDYYAFGFDIQNEVVVSEWLYSIRKKTSKLIYERKTEDKATSVEFGNVDINNQEEKQFLQFVARGTRPNQLFLTESINNNVEHFEHVYSWFDDTLSIIFPDSAFSGLEIGIKTDESLKKQIGDMLDSFNTGVSGITYKSVESRSESIPDKLFAEIKEDLEEGINVVVRSPDGRRFLLRRSSDTGEVLVSEMVAEHQIKDSDEVAHLEIAYESDGTQRLLELIPSLLSLMDNEKVFVIDELDRSLHPSVSYEILELFLSETGGHPSQLVVTTHETGLLDLELLRRDEIWFIEKNKYGESDVYSLEEYTPRYDKDIQKGYLMGRFGAIPMIHGISDLGWGK